LSPDEISGLETKLKLTGLLMCVLVPLMILLTVWILLVPKETGSPIDSADTEFFVWILSAMSFAEPVIGFVLRKRLLNADAILARSPQTGLRQAIFAGHMLGYAFALSPALFGLVIYLVTHNAILASILMCLSPLAYLFFRPTEATVQELSRVVEAKLTSK
jgi:hypothetical protein